MVEKDKLTPKQEKFAQCIFEGMSQTDAYRSSFNVRPGTKDSSIHVSASKMMSDPKVAQRIATLREPVVKKAQFTLEQHLEELKTLSDLAKGEGKYAAAVTAEVARGKARGFYVEKHEHSGPEGGPIPVASVNVSELSDKELESFAKILGKLQK